MRFSMKRILHAATLLALLAPAARADLISDWNNQLLGAVRVGSTAPPLASRAMAMVHTAMFDAVNSIDRSYQPYHVKLPSSATTSQEAAAAQAARDVLVQLYPAQAASFDVMLTTHLAAIPNSSAKTDGISLGSGAAAAILALRSADHSSETTSYTPGGNPGDWRPTAPAHAPALLPNWPSVTPWTMSSGSQFRHPTGPPALDSPAYLADLAEVRELGSATSVVRTADQTEVAQFWADGGGTATPAGHWNRIAQSVVADQGLSLIESARSFALLNLGLADAAIACWDNKYAYDFWRPITAIREDGTAPDPSWTPLIATPPFPSYTSGHSTFSGAASTILADLFGDATSFQSAQDNQPLIVRSFTSFSQAAGEAAESRLYGGIHFRFDNEDGLAGGQALGRFVVDNYLMPVPEPASLSLTLISVVAALCCHRRHARRI
jgi:hypothetical protein